MAQIFEKVLGILVCKYKMIAVPVQGVPGGPNTQVSAYFFFIQTAHTHHVNATLDNGRFDMILCPKTKRGAHLYVSLK